MASSNSRTCTTASSRTLVQEPDQDKDQCIRGNLTPLELKQLADIKSKLESLKMPQTPQTAYELYCSESQGNDKRSWEALSDSEKVRLESKSSLLFAQY